MYSIQTVHLQLTADQVKDYPIGAIPEGASCTVYPDRMSGNWCWVSITESADIRIKTILYYNNKY